jgi:O-antigen ligase
MKKLDAPTTTLWDSLYKFGLAAILIFIPLYPKFPLFTVPFSYVAIRAEDFLIALVWFIFLIRLLVSRKIKFPTISPQFAIFFFVTFVSSLSAILITKNVQPLIVILHFLRRIEYMSVFFLVYWAAKDTSTRRYYLELALLPSIGVFLYGIAQIFMGAPVISTMDSESSKGIALTLRPGVTLNSTFAGHYDLAVYLNMIMTYLAAITVAVNGWLKRLPFLVLFVMLLWLFMQAGSRVGLLGLVFSVCLVSFFYRRYLLGLGFILIIFSFIATSPQYISRFQSILKVFSAKTSQVVAAPVYASVAAPTPSPIATPSATPEALRAIQQDTSTSIRFDVEWPRAIRAFYKNPLLGTGYSSISLATDNDYLRALGETGLLGLLAFLSILFGILKALLSLVRKVSGSDKIIVVSSIGIFAAFLTTAIFIDVFESSKIAILFWAYMGLALSINSQKNV